MFSRRRSSCTSSLAQILCNFIFVSEDALAYKDIAPLKETRKKQTQ
jgi:hypothetical protein